MQNQPLTPENIQVLRRIKIGVFLLLFIFAIQTFTSIPELWPITRWPMYSEKRSYPLPQTNAQTLQITDSNGGIHKVFMAQLGMLGGRILSAAFDVQDAALRDHYQELLTKRVQAALPNLDLADIQMWEDRWTIHDDQFPPFSLDAPDSEKFIDSFPSALYTQTDPPDTEPDLLFGNSLALLAFRLVGSNEVAACGAVHAQTWWSTLQQPSANYQITLVLADASGIGRAQNDGQLAFANTVDWLPGYQTLDRRSIIIPCDLPPGAYNLLVGLYNLQTLQNLPITYLDGSPYGQLAYLTTINVKEKSGAP